MKAVDQFTTLPKQNEFDQYADGNIYRAIQGDDYSDRRGFLIALAHYGKRNGLNVVRSLGEDWVEFTFEPMTAEQHAAAEAAKTARKAAGQAAASKVVNRLKPVK